MASTHNIGIEIKQKELTKTFMMISKLKKLCSLDLYLNISQLHLISYCDICSWFLGTRVIIFQKWKMTQIYEINLDNNPTLQIWVIFNHLKLWIAALEHWAIQFKFSVTKSCVSLPRYTTSSEWRCKWFVKFKFLHISVFQDWRHTLLLTTLSFPHLK